MYSKASLLPPNKMPLSLRAALCLGTLGLAVSAAHPPTVDLGYVSYTGYTNETAQINYFYSIPYAQPPLGHLRWRAPRPIEASNTFTGQTINATTPPPMCYQSLPLSLASSGSGLDALQGLPQSEDCLVVNVKVPQNPDSDSLPVIVMLRTSHACRKTEEMQADHQPCVLQMAEDTPWALLKRFPPAMR